VEVPYAIRLEEVHWLREPIELTAEVRGRLSAFQGRDPDKGWAWFVQGTSKLTEDDFNLLTGRIGKSQESASVKRERRGSSSALVSISDDYKGTTVRAVIFQSKRYEVHSWKDAMLALFEVLRQQDQPRFEKTALTLVGRKRPYITRDRDALRTAQRIPNTASLYVETNLSANYIVKLCYTLVTELGYDQSLLVFEAE
jgi:hypothetical protein